jgi:hypothetical protein
MKKTTLLMFAAAAVTVHAQSIISWEYDNGNRIPVNGSSFAGVASAAYWNYSQGSGVANLLASDGSSSGVSLGFSSAYGTWGIGGVSGPDADGTYNKSIFDGYGNGGLDTLSLSGISFSQYDVIVYFSSDTDGRTGTVSDGAATYDFSTIMRNQLNNNPNVTFIQTTDTTGANPGANYAVFTDLTGASQTLTTIHTAAAGLGIAGMQIVAAPGTVHNGTGRLGRHEPVVLAAAVSVSAVLTNPLRFYKAPAATVLRPAFLLYSS